MRIDHALLCSLVPVLATACTGSAPRSAAPEPAPVAPPAPAAPEPLAPELEALLERGRGLLDAGQPLEAEALFTQVAAHDGDSLRTRMWVLRAWMDQGRSNDTLDALDALDHAGQKGPDMTYLYGMAFARRAEGYVASGVTDSSVQMNFLDATSFLKDVLQQDARRYHDAFVPLARAARFTEDLDTARWAADGATASAASSPESWVVRGRVVMAQFVAAEREQPGSAEAEALWTEATSSLQRAIELFGLPATDARALSLAQTATELGHALLWKQKVAEATQAYATAIAWAPEAFDYGQAQGLLSALPTHADDGTPIGFRAALEEGRTRFEARTGASDPRTGALLWWLGWARFADADWTASEEAFLASLERAPDFTNAWFYIGLARQYAKDSEGALGAMHKGWESDPTTMVKSVQGAGGSLRAFESLIDWCAAQEPAKNLEAAFLAEMLAQAFPDVPRYWNNFGLFLRDEGERLETDAYHEKAPEPDPAVLTDLYTRSYGAYQRALELSPDDPQILNDTALMRQYHLDGQDPAEIEAMYRRSIALTEQRLAATDLSTDDRTRFEQTLKDADENLKHLLEPDKEDDATAQSTAASANPDKP